MTEIIKFERFNSEELEVMDLDSFKQFLISQRGNKRISSLVETYLAIRSEMETGIYRNSFKFNNGLIGSEVAEKNTKRYFRLGMELAAVRREIIDKIT